VKSRLSPILIRNLLKLWTWSITLIVDCRKPLYTKVETTIILFASLGKVLYAKKLCVPVNFLHIRRVCVVLETGGNSRGCSGYRINEMSRLRGSIRWRLIRSNFEWGYHAVFGDGKVTTGCSRPRRGSRSYSNIKVILDQTESDWCITVIKLFNLESFGLHSFLKF
jgi:hypothetical protein